MQASLFSDVNMTKQADHFKQTSRRQTDDGAYFLHH